MRQCVLLAAGLAVLTAGAAPAATTIKLSTLAPKDSSYHQALVRMGQEWRRITNGEVRLDVFPGGVQGGESAMIRRMRAGQLQAALLTGVGLSEIEPAVAGLQSIPLMFRDLSEVDLAGEILHPVLEQKFEEKGFKVLFWTDAGWVQFFSRKPMRTVDDLRKLKLFSWASTGKADNIARSLGVNPVPLETADILPGLQTGIIDVVAMPPFYALGTQIYTVAGYMLDLRWAPLAGALVMDKRAWEKIPETAREQILSTARQTGDLIKATSRKESEDAVRTMQEKWGLKVLTPTPAEFDSWRATLEGVYDRIRGEIVPAEVWDVVVPKIKASRGAKP